MQSYTLSGYVIPEDQRKLLEAELIRNFGEIEYIEYGDELLNIKMVKEMSECEYVQMYTIVNPYILSNDPLEMLNYMTTAINNIEYDKLLLIEREITDIYNCNPTKILRRQIINMFKKSSPEDLCLYNNILLKYK